MKVKNILALALVLALSLAVFALPAAAQTHEHDGCCEETVIMRRPPAYVCPSCGVSCIYVGAKDYTFYCPECHQTY